MSVDLRNLGGALRTLISETRESVALLLGVKSGGLVKVLAVYRLDNRLDSKARFEADPWQVVQAHVSAEKYGLEVVGLLHTHPECPATPSSLDAVGMRSWRMPWVIVCKDEVRAWALDDGSLKELEVLV